MMKLLPKLARIGTPSFRRFLVDHAPFKFVKDVRDIVDTLYNTSIEIFESKKKALAEGDEAFAAQIGRGKDIISILSKLTVQHFSRIRLRCSNATNYLSEGQFVGRRW